MSEGQARVRPARPGFETKSGASRNRTWSRYVLTVLAYALLVALWQQQPVPLLVYIAGVGVAALALLPITLWYAGGLRGAPMFEMVCLSYGLQYSLPLYLRPNQMVLADSRTVLFAWDATLQTLIMTAAGLGAMIAGFYGFKRSRLARKLPHLRLHLTDTQLARYLVVATILGLGTTLASAIGFAPTNDGPAGGVVRILQLQTTVGFTLLAYRVFGLETRTGPWAYFLYIWLAASVGLGLVSGSLENAFTPLVIVLIVRWHVGKKMPWRFLMLGGISFVLLNSVKANYRSQVWTRETAPTIEQRVSVWLDLSQSALQGTLSGDVLTNTQDSVNVTAGRLDLIHPFMLVYDVAPGQVPFLTGRSYAPLLSTWIPRAVWPDKPSTSDATNDLAVSYGFQLPSQVGKGSVGIGQLAEAYGNFGVLGILLVAAAQGIVFAILDVMLNGAGAGAYRSVYLVVMVGFLNGIGTSTAVIFGGIVENTAPLALIVRWISGGRSRLSTSFIRAAQAAPDTSLERGHV